MGTAKEVPSNLPVPLTSFIGREAERVAVRDVIADNRLVTLTGAGGSGKTRLAVAVAREVSDRYPGGAYWVDFARLSDDTLVPNAIAAGVGIKEVPGQSLLDTLANGIGKEPVLLLLDNCEHVIDACAGVVDGLLRACPSLSIFATSREPIGVEGEIAWRVPSLRLADEAVRLFVERAKNARPEFALSDETEASVREIVARLDGVPLAIELAAARVRMMTTEQIVAGLADRFRLLIGSTRTAVPRQQTLRASVEWSYDLLTEQERVVLRRLAVFAGGFTLDAAEYVCSGDVIAGEDVLDLVTRLVDRSLVQTGDGGTDTRFRLLETIRQYAMERLVEADEPEAIRGRHCDFYVSLARRAEPEILADGLFRWLPVLDIEHDNLRAAFDWSAESQGLDDCLRLCAALWQYWMVRGHMSEGRTRFERALEAPDDDRTLRADALVGVAQLMLYEGDFDAAGSFAREALGIADEIGDERLRGRALDTLAWSVAFLDPPSAPALFDRAAESSRKAGDIPFIADAYNGLGTARYFAGDYVGARAAFEEGIARSREAGNPSMLAMGLGILGFTLALQGRLARAMTCLRESLALMRRLGDRVFTAQSLYSIGFVDAHRGDHAGAQALVDESVEIGREVSPMILSFALLTQGIARYARADLAGAASALEETLDLARDMPVPWLSAWALALLGNISRLRGDLSDAKARVDDALATAKVGGLRAELLIDAEARLARAGGEPERAESLHHEAIAAAIDAQSVLLIPTELEALAGLAGVAESFAEAARLFGAGEAARDAHGIARYAAEQDEYEADVEHVRAAIPDEEFRAAWEQGRAMSLDDAIAYASRGRGERKRPSSGWASLTPTEVEVVRQVTAGLKNAQIAERLFVSPSTVKVHLSHIFSKLGVATRAELAAQATRRSL